MKKFNVPEMQIQKLEQEDIMRTSTCFETFACKSCYCSVVQCGIDTYGCVGLVCPTLSDYD